MYVRRTEKYGVQNVQYIIYPDHQKLLEKVAFGNGDEYAYRDGGNDERTT